MKVRAVLAPVAVVAVSALLSGCNRASVDVSAASTDVASTDWSTYSGDYSGRRYSDLAQINQSTVSKLVPAWSTVLQTDPGAMENTNVGGVGKTIYSGDIKVVGVVLKVGSVLYTSAPDNAWAIDARDGRVLWHFVWKTRGGSHIGNRGPGYWNSRIYFETPDNFLVCLDAKTGSELWHSEIADFSQRFFSTMAPIIVENHVLVGTGNDLAAPGLLQAFDPETGERQWVWYAVPMKAGDAGLDTWKGLDAARYGGGLIWIPGVYDPVSRLYITGTGNPLPAYTSQSRGEGDNLFTCSVVAINVDTGKMAWYYQVSPHDTHDWDSTQTPVLVDREFGGRMRRLVLFAARNGYFFTLDRDTGEHLVTGKFSETINWAKGLNATGQPIRNPEKDFHVGGALVSPNNLGVTNWPPPSFHPGTGLFYVPEYDTFALYYLTESDPRGAMGLGGKEEADLDSVGTYLTAIDYATGRVAWRHSFPGIPQGSATPTGGSLTGVLSTAGQLLFLGDNAANLVALDAATGVPVWHYPTGTLTNAPETYALDGHQYLLVAAGDMLHAFALGQSLR